MAVKPYAPDDFRRIAGQLTDVYREGERTLLKLISGDDLSGFKRALLEERLAQVQAIINGLDAETVDWAGVHIPSVYEHNLQLGAQRAGLNPAMTAIHQEQVAVIQNSVVNSLHYANGGIGRSIEDAYRQASLKALQEGMIGGQTGTEVSKSFLADLKERGITSFVDKSGRSWDMTSYADMVARTNTMEASKQATYNQMLEADRDLVQVSDHGEPCEVCEPWEGEVLSLSGENPNYPSVSEAEADGLFHPNCLHDLLPYGGERE